MLSDASASGPVTLHNRVDEVTLKTFVLGQPCHVRGRIKTTDNLANGDQTQTVTVDEIISSGGQTILTNMLSVDEFRVLVYKLLISANP